MIAGREIDGALPTDSCELAALVDDLTLYAIVGIVDPPRTEAADAIKVARGAGIAVHMITGDHRTTAAAIARDLGIPGESVSGSELDRLDDEELRARAPGFGWWRASPRSTRSGSSRRCSRAAR